LEDVHWARSWGFVAENHDGLSVLFGWTHDCQRPGICTALLYEHQRPTGQYQDYGDEIPFLQDGLRDATILTQSLFKGSAWFPQAAAG